MRSRNNSELAGCVSGSERTKAAEGFEDGTSSEIFNVEWPEGNFFRERMFGRSGLYVFARVFEFEHEPLNFRRLLRPYLRGAFDISIPETRRVGRKCAQFRL